MLYIWLPPDQLSTRMEIPGSLPYSLFTHNDMEGRRYSNMQGDLSLPIGSIKALYMYARVYILLMYVHVDGLASYKG